MNWQFYLNSILLGVGLSMDACAVSMANGLNEPNMKPGKTSLVAFLFGFFQALMPLLGWLCVHFIAQQFAVFNQLVPYIALGLLAFIGGKMIYEGVQDSKNADTEPTPTVDDATNVSETDEVVDINIPETSASVTPQQSTDTSNTTNTAKPAKSLTLRVLLVQAVATSIDALSVGFTIAEYNLWQTLVCVAIIAVVTFAICFGSVFIGKKFGTKLGNKAEILGGVILILIGVEIFVSGVFF